MNKVFFHTYIYKNWRLVYDDLMQKIVDSGLINNAEINVVYTNADRFPDDAIIDGVNYINGGNNQFEYPTLSLLYEFAKQDENNSNILYFHTKGVSRSSNNVTDWKNMMAYFNIEKWEDRVEELKQFDATGCNLSKGHQQGMRAMWFAGNFWWSKSDYVKKLQDPNTWKSNRLMAEFWLGMANGNFNLVHHSGINHYQKPYPKEKYIK